MFCMTDASTTGGGSLLCRCGHLRASEGSGVCSQDGLHRKLDPIGVVGSGALRSHKLDGHDGKATCWRKSKKFRRQFRPDTCFAVFVNMLYLLRQLWL